MAENLSDNMQKLADFSINETTDFAKLKQKYPEINKDELIQIAIDNVNLTSNQLDYIFAHLNEKKGQSAKQLKENIFVGLIRSHHWNAVISFLPQVTLLSDKNITECYLHAIACNQDVFIKQFNTIFPVKFDIVAVCRSNDHDRLFSSKAWLTIIKFGLQEMITRFNRLLSTNQCFS